MLQSAAIYVQAPLRCLCCQEYGHVAAVRVEEAEDVGDVGRTKWRIVKNKQSASTAKGSTMWDKHSAQKRIKEMKASKSKVCLTLKLLREWKETSGWWQSKRNRSGKGIELKIMN